MYFNCSHISYFVLFYNQELLSEQNIPSISISASRKPFIVRNQLLMKLQPLLANRQSLFQTCQPISSTLAQRLLLFSYKLHSAFGCWDPIKVIFPKTVSSFVRGDLLFIDKSCKSCVTYCLSTLPSSTEIQGDRLDPASAVASEYHTPCNLQSVYLLL